MRLLTTVPRRLFFRKFRTCCCKSTLSLFLLIVAFLLVCPVNLLCVVNQYCFETNTHKSECSTVFEGITTVWVMPSTTTSCRRPYDIRNVVITWRVPATTSSILDHFGKHPRNSVTKNAHSCRIAALKGEHLHYIENIVKPFFPLRSRRVSRSLEFHRETGESHLKIW